MDPKGRLKIGVFTLLLIIGMGVVGYYLLEGLELLDALYMTVITISTVGFREVGVLSPAGKIFTLFIIIFGVGTTLFVFGSATQLIVEGELRKFLGRRKVEKRIEKLRDHYIICGYGRIGKLICKELWKKSVPFVCIERNQESARRAEEEGYLCINGDATEEEILNAAGIQRARGLVSVLVSDSDNVFITLTARGLNPGLYVLARAEEEGTERKLRRAGADRVMSPHHIGGLRMAHAILKPAVVDFIEIATHSESIELQMEEISIGPKSSLAGANLRESGIRKALGTIIVAIKKASGSMVFNPPPEIRMEAGDVLIVLGEPDSLKKLEIMAGG